VKRPQMRKQIDRVTKIVRLTEKGPLWKPKYAFWWFIEYLQSVKKL